MEGIKMGVLTGNIVMREFAKVLRLEVGRKEARMDRQLRSSLRIALSSFVFIACLF
jgi:hypothetical protein